MTDNEKVAANAGFGSKNPTTEAQLDVEREPMPRRTPEANSDDLKTPPARNGGAAEAREKPTEGDTKDNPVHHTGHIPSPVTANRE